ncbi:HK97 gp10 family phage protein [Sphingopyxis sp. QXT-31]|uniref:HK97 gp10 family phage protein n=1 Tax=Sphingopyxis sp. QXT-31 TaxID=1357916 RepID=UPI001E5D198C|nr:HK97 gp10 family phage protein [Sphingopyxis sp. QXT-31]
MRRFLTNIPEQMDGVLRGAARAGGKVVADEIKDTTPSEEVRDNIRIRTKAESDHIRVRIDVKDRWARSLGIWLEYGTDPHFISVDESQRGGRSVGRINTLAKDSDKGHSLLIGGNFVGSTVFHPGARPHPAFRPALDRKEAEAVAAAQAYINTRVSRAGIKREPAGGDE